MQLVRYDPFRELQNIEQEMAKSWPGVWGWLPAHTETAPMDMYEEGNNLIAEVALPNFSKEEVHVSTDGGMLEITAEHAEKEETKGKRRYHFRESSNQYARHVTLPEGAVVDKTAANFKDGVLTVTIPMATTHKKTKAISVK